MINKYNDKRGIFPKVVPYLTPEQKLIKDDFMEHWLQVLRNNYGIVDRFNHKIVVRNKSKNFLKTLEIGAGLGEHLNYEELNEDQKRNYYALDIRENLLKILAREHPLVKPVLGDSNKMEFKDNFFDRVIAIHVLEHLPDLPKTINEISRVLSINGLLQVVIPCEGSMAYSLARKISAERIFKKKYNTSYDWFIKSEHLNLPYEIFNELKERFTITEKFYFPFPIPFEFCNLCIGINLKLNPKY